MGCIECGSNNVWRYNGKDGNILGFITDEIYGILRVVFKTDHKDFRKSWLYEFRCKNPL